MTTFHAHCRGDAAWDTEEFASKAAQCLQRLVDDAAFSGPHPLVNPKDSIFFGSERVTITLQNYIRRLVRHSLCPLECHMGAIALIQRLDTLGRKDLMIPRALHRLYLAALVVCTKMSSDIFDTMKFYAIAGGVHVQEMLLLEPLLMCAVGFDLHVSEDCYEAAHTSVFGLDSPTSESFHSTASMT